MIKFVTIQTIHNMSFLITNLLLINLSFGSLRDFISSYQDICIINYTCMDI